MQEEGVSAHLQHHKVLMSPPLDHECVIVRRSRDILITEDLWLLHLTEFALDGHLKHKVRYFVQIMLQMDIVLVVLDAFIDLCTRNIYVLRVIQTDFVWVVHPTRSSFIFDTRR